ncbi:hypothetical protein G4B88_001409 [Cannabis sativa]|uniref:Uncharacterized protein n=1 Tax=Cannabis sativa TaxID=3483 RepID=A0A7J6FAA0_CANSA|nr:hypothetical protein G4B88_001409 [Cannabis sativa]
MIIGESGVESGVIELRVWSHLSTNQKREGVQHCRKKVYTCSDLGRSVVERAFGKERVNDTDKGRDGQRWELTESEDTRGRAERKWLYSLKFLYVIGGCEMRTRGWPVTMWILV